MTAHPAPALDWIDRLRTVCDDRGRSAVLAELRDASGSAYPSPTIISQVLGGTYPSDPARLRALVEGLYCGATVDCPVLGTIGRDQCEYHQGRPFAAANPMLVAVWRACRDGCDHSRHTHTQEARS